MNMHNALDLILSTAKAHGLDHDDAILKVEYVQIGDVIKPGAQASDIEAGSKEAIGNLVEHYTTIVVEFASGEIEEAYIERETFVDSKSRGITREELK